MRRIWPGAFLFLLFACGSPRTHYYTLSPIGSVRPAADEGQPLKLGQVIVAAALDRDSLVEWSGSGELKISEQNRWAAPLDGMIRGVVAEDLRERLPVHVYLPGDVVAPGPVRSVNLNIRRFGAQENRRVTLVADWSVLAGKPLAVVLGRSETINVPLKSSDVPAVVLAMNQALAELSERMASAIMRRSA
jgi:uncharacterized lipoprotein YmbA